MAWVSGSCVDVLHDIMKDLDIQQEMDALTTVLTEFLQSPLWQLMSDHLALCATAKKKVKLPPQILQALDTCDLDRPSVIGVAMLHWLSHHGSPSRNQAPVTVAGSVASSDAKMQASRPSSSGGIAAVGLLGQINSVLFMLSDHSSVHIDVTLAASQTCAQDVSCP